MTARQVREELYAETQHGTVQRLLQSLEDKGFIARDKSLSVHLFSAAMTREAYAGQQLETLADKLTGGSIAPFLTHLLTEKKLSRTELTRLRRLLETTPKRGKRRD